MNNERQKKGKLKKIRKKEKEKNGKCEINNERQKKGNLKKKYIEREEREKKKKEEREKFEG